MELGVEFDQNIETQKGGITFFCFTFRSDLLRSCRFNIGQHLMIQLLVISTRELHHTKIAATSCH